MLSSDHAEGHHEDQDGAKDADDPGSQDGHILSVPHDQPIGQKDTVPFPDW
jgi:hypothetical protein